MGPRLRVWPYVIAALAVPPVTIVIAAVLGVVSQSNGGAALAFALMALGVVAGIASLVVAIRNVMSNRRLNRAELLEAIADAQGE